MSAVAMMALARTCGCAAILAAVLLGVPIAPRAAETLPGPVRARVAGTDGADIAAVLIARGLAQPYDGRRRIAWCG
ncbi:MAG: hypothetical protein IT563_12930 [Alphaproteobacteria bacterium]|nr:hypothetical protein [Alphaproteobacteria bacterium]